MMSLTMSSYTGPYALFSGEIRVPSQLIGTVKPLRILHGISYSDLSRFVDFE
jgi:hypothetical protein